MNGQKMIGIFRAGLILCGLVFPMANGNAASAIAGDFCEIYGYETKQGCDAGEVYGGPNAVKEHGGVCLIARGGCDLVGSYAETISCRSGGTYVGPNRADLHGGTCLRLTRGQSRYRLESIYVKSERAKGCDGEGVYVGPDDVESHGGYCLYIYQRDNRNPNQSGRR
jgi:hypothetical protein